MSQLDPSIENRVDEILADMTIEEKAGQLTQFFYFAEISMGAWRALCSPDCGPNRVPIGKDELG